MKRLTHRQMQLLLAGISELNASHDPATLPTRIFAAAKRVVATDWVALTVWDAAAIRGDNPATFPIIAMHTEPHIAVTPTMRETYNNVFHEEPFKESFLRNGLVVPHRVSDIMPDSRYYRLSIYNEHFRKIEIDRAMVVGLSASPDVAVTVSLIRRRVEFTDGELAAFAALRPHLIAAHNSAEAFAELQREQVQYRHALEESERVLVILNAGGRVRSLTRSARELLAKYFILPLNDHLPDELTHWLAHCARHRMNNGTTPPVPPFEIKRGDASLCVRLLVDERNENKLLLLSEKRDGVPVQALVSLGLTKREAEVLGWVAQGKTNAEVAVLCDVSARTVQKHLEHIYQKLGVETRVAATRMVMDTLGKV